MDAQRLKKVENVAKKIVSAGIRDVLTEEENKMFRLVNVVGVKLSPDVSYLDVYVSSFLNPDKLTKALATHANTIEKELFRELAMRKHPKLRFRYDNSGEISSEIIGTINSL